LAGDLTAALAYATPAGGSVLTPVAPVGLRDRGAATVTFTTSLGFGRKLDRLRENPRIALAYHAREHGFASGEDFVLVQGTASFEERPDPQALEALEEPVTRFMGARQTGPFWDRWLQAYYQDRVLVTVSVERVCSWPDPSAAGEPRVAGAPLAAGAPPPHAEPRHGTAPRVDAERAAARAVQLPHV